MRKNWKKWWLLLFSVLSFCVISMGGCNGCKEDETDEDETRVEVGQEETTALRLNHEYATIEVYDTLALVVEDIQDGVPVWSSSDETVATVSQDGVVSTLSAGTAVVSVSVGELTGECKITVTDSGLLPVLSTSADETLALIKNAEYALNPVLRYCNKVVAGVTFTYSSSNESVATVKNGLIQAVGYGEADVTVSTEWKDFDMAFTSARIKVSVVPNIGLQINNADDLTLYTCASVDGETFKTNETVELGLTVDGEAQTLSDYTFTWEIENQDVASLSGNRIYAVGAGETVLAISCNVEFENQTFALQTQATVNVVRPVIDKDVELLVDTWIDTNGERDKTNITVDGATLFSGGETVVAVTDETDRIAIEYTLENGAFANGEIPRLGDRTWVVYNEDYGYRVSTCVASMVITTADDLKVLSDLFNQAGLENGYFVLDNDINYKGEQFAYKASWGKVVYPFFNGTIDGRGHTISNVSLFHGLVFKLGLYGSIKNLALVNAVSTNWEYSCAFASECKGTLENVYASYTTSGTSNCGAFAYRLYDGAKIINSVVEVTYASDKTPGETCGAFASMLYYGSEITNSYVISDAYADRWAKEGENKGTQIQSAIVASFSQLTATQVANNSFCNGERILISTEQYELQGLTALSANMPVTWSIAENESVSLTDGVLSTDSATPVEVLVTATSKYDSEVTAQRSVTVVKASPKRIGGAKVNVLTATNDEYEILISDYIDVNDVVWAVVGSNLDRKYSHFSVHETNNSIRLPKGIFTSGSNTLYLATSDKYYVMSVKLSAMETVPLGTVDIVGEPTDGYYKILLGSTLSVTDISYYIFDTDVKTVYRDFDYDETENALIIPANSLTDGANVLYLITQDGHYDFIVNNWLNSTPITTAEELKTAFESSTTGERKAYYLANDIDMAGVSIDYASVNFYDALDGNGHKIENVSYTYRWIANFGGTLKNVYIDASTSGSTAIFGALIDAATFENVYVSLTIDGSNANGTIVVGALAESTHNAHSQTKTLKNVIVNVQYVHFENVSSVELGLIREYRNGDLDITNSYLISQRRGALVKRYGTVSSTATLTREITLVNGSDVSKELPTETDRTKKTEIDFGNEYVFDNMSVFALTPYAEDFTRSFWSEVVVYDEEAYWQGYTKISTGAELKAAIESSTTTSKYYLANDIDMTGITVDNTKWIFGTWEGNGKKVYNIAYTGRWLAGIEGTLKNVSFYATATIANGTVNYAIVNFIGAMNDYATFDNVYIDLSVNANDATYGNGAGYISSVFVNPIAQTTNNNQTKVRTYKDVVVNVKFENWSHVTTTTLSAMYDLSGGSISMTNVYMIAPKLSTSCTYSLFNMFASSSKITSEKPVAYTIQNGDDAVLTETYTATSTAKSVCVGRDYVFETKSAFTASAYAQTFTGDMWTAIFAE